MRELSASINFWDGIVWLCGVEWSGKPSKLILQRTSSQKQLNAGKLDQAPEKGFQRQTRNNAGHGALLFSILLPRDDFKGRSEAKKYTSVRVQPVSGSNGLSSQGSPLFARLACYISMCCLLPKKESLATGHWIGNTVSLFFPLPRLVGSCT